MTAEASGPSSSNSADSHIGSVVSLITKSGYRYEGVVVHIDTVEASIGLGNVRSFGTEGRKTDDPQVPESDKVYEYILFRGSGIRDLRVKVALRVQTAAPVYSDPAIIQTHCSQETLASRSFPAAGAGSLQYLSSHSSQMALPKTTFQGSVPLCQSSGSSGSWVSSIPPPATNGAELTRPTYWQGFYGVPDGLQAHQQSLLQPPPRLSMSPCVQQPLQYPAVNASLPARASNFPALQLSNFPPPFLPSFGTGTLNSPSSLRSVQSSSVCSGSPSTLMSNSAATQALPPPALSTFGTSTLHLPSAFLSGQSSAIASGLPKTFISIAAPTQALPPPPLITFGTSTLDLPLPFLSWQSSAVASGSPSTLISNASPTQSLPPPALSTSLSLVSPFTSVSEEITLAPAVPNEPTTGPGSVQPHDGASALESSVGATSGSLRNGGSTPSLVTPAQFLQPGPTKVFPSQSSQTARKEHEVTQVSSSELPVQTVANSRGPILHLPSPHVRKLNGAPSRAHYSSRVQHERVKENGSNRAPSHPHHSNRGRHGVIRENGLNGAPSHSHNNTIRQHEGVRENGASNPATRFAEDFDFIAMNKKFNKDEVWGHLGKSNKAQEDDNGSQDGNDAGPSNFEPVYVKDDFFDSLSSNALDRGSRNGRPNFSERMKLDTETFGDFPRHWGGRGRGRGGYSRGAYYSRSNGNTGRGQEDQR